MKQSTGLLIATVLGSSMVFIDGTVVNVILPILQRDFQASGTEIQWVVEAYLLFLASLILIGGSLGDRYGRRKIFLLGTIIFMLTSVGCALSQSLLQLTICRSLQGIGGALLTPGSLSIINSYFSEAERGKAIGTWSGFSAIMAVFGPVFGGLLSDQVSWRLVFLINFPIGILVILFSLKFIPEAKPENASSSLDGFGVILSTLGTGALVYGLVESLIPAMVSGFVLLVSFVWVEAHTKNPLVPLSFFKSRVFSIINLATFFLYSALSIVFYFLPFNLIQVQGFSATWAGAANLPFVIIIFLSSRFTGGLYTKMGARLPIGLGSIIVGLSFIGLGYSATLASNYWTQIFPWISLFGLGMALCVSPLTTAVLSALPKEVSGIASGINNSVSRIAGLLGIAIMTWVIVKLFQGHLQQIAVGSEIKTAMLSKSHELAAMKGFSAEEDQAIKIAYLQSFKEVLLISSLLAFLSSIAVFLFLPRFSKSLPPQ